MATTKKSTKAKTKKTVSAKTTKTTAVTKANTTIKKLLLISTLVSATGAVLAGLLIGNASYEIVSGLLAKNELATGSSTSYVPAVKHVYDLEIRWAVVTIMGLATLCSLGFLTVYRNRFNAAIRAKVNGLRWLDMAIVGALMLELTALLSGINDIATLKFMASLVVIACALGWIAEKRLAQGSKLVKSELWLAFIAGVLPWVAIACHAINTVVFGRIGGPWYVYALYGILFAGFIGYTSTLVSVARGKAKYETAESNYLALGILIKVAFVAVLIAGLR